MPDDVHSDKIAVIGIDSLGRLLGSTQDVQFWRAALILLLLSPSGAIGFFYDSGLFRFVGVITMIYSPIHSLLSCWEFICYRRTARAFGTAAVSGLAFLISSIPVWLILFYQPPV